MKTKIQKREEAMIRQAEYAALSTDQRIARANSRPGANTKELLKLSKLLSKEAEK